MFVVFNFIIGWWEFFCLLTLMERKPPQVLLNALSGEIEEADLVHNFEHITQPLLKIDTFLFSEIKKKRVCIYISISRIYFIKFSKLLLPVENMINIFKNY